MLSAKHLKHRAIRRCSSEAVKEIADPFERVPAKFRVRIANGPVSYMIAAPQQFRVEPIVVKLERLRVEP